MKEEETFQEKFIVGSKFERLEEYLQQAQYLLVEQQWLSRCGVFMQKPKAPGCTKFHVLFPCRYSWQNSQSFRLIHLEN